MLVIRPEQMATLEQDARGRREQALVDELRRFAPRHAEVLGEAGVREVVALGLERAARHRFTEYGPVHLYLECIAMFGCDFDTDPQFPWASAALAGADTSTQIARADRLYERAKAYVERVAGPDHALARQALRRASTIRLEESPALGPQFEVEIARRLHGVYPEKCRDLGTAGVAALVQRAVAAARAFGTDTNVGFTVFIGLTFTLGHGFAHDPQYPWIRSTLARNGPEDANRRAERLGSKMLTYLAEVVRYLDRQP